MAGRIGLILQSEGMGDCLFAIPVIRKLRQIEAPDTVFDLFSHHPDLFRACPYVAGNHRLDEGAVAIYAANNRIARLFDLQALPHWAMNTCDFISIPLGIGQLTLEEKQLEYFPVEQDCASHFDVVLNTSMTWPSRTWVQENWQRLADSLVARGLSVAVVGKDVRSASDEMEKRSPALAGCVDLVGQLSLDQTRFTIAHAGLFVSCQNGLAVLAGTTETECVILDKSVEWSRHAVIRHESPLYRATYVKGLCRDYCGVIDRCPKPENRGAFLCIPSFERVEAAVLQRLRASGRLP
ncbi:glycosyltransferase family 9 protein [Uliginosibacterium paludis]|uniref:Glycosyltransferase family 9 protein n=1 Tax=Uliginosibacterium paludis TaxID=1615952 RepID=A0ABV2CW74_9RHOO